MTVQSNLARYQTSSPMTPAQIDVLGARAWVEQETLVVRLNQVADPDIQQKIRDIAESLYG